MTCFFVIRTNTSFLMSDLIFSLYNFDGICHYSWANDDQVKTIGQMTLWNACLPVWNRIGGSWEIWRPWTKEILRNELGHPVSANFTACLKYSSILSCDLLDKRFDEHNQIERSCSAAAVIHQNKLNWNRNRYFK